MNKLKKILLASAASGVLVVGGAAAYAVTGPTTSDPVSVNMVSITGSITVADMTYSEEAGAYQYIVDCPAGYMYYNGLVTDYGPTAGVQGYAFYPDGPYTPHYTNQAQVEEWYGDDPDTIDYQVICISIPS